MAECFPPCPPLVDLQAKHDATKVEITRLRNELASVDARHIQARADFADEVKGKLTAIMDAIQGLYDFLTPASNGGGHE